MRRASGLVLCLLFMALPCHADVRDVTFEARSDVTISAPLTQLEVVGWSAEHLQLIGENLNQAAITRTATGVHISIGDPAPGHLKIKIPPARNISIKGGLANVTLSNLTGDIHVDVSNNPIHASNIKGSVKATSQLAPIKLRSVSGDVRAESNWAAVTLDDIGGSVWARTAGASISLKNSRSQKVELQALNGTVTFEGLLGGSSDYVIASHRGEIDVTLSTRSDVTVALHGDPADFSITGAQTIAVNEQTAQHVIGQGQGRMILESPKGPIRLTVKPDP